MWSAWPFSLSMLQATAFVLLATAECPVDFMQGALDIVVALDVSVKF